LDNRDVDHLA
jgi:hypothetical protein